MGVCVYVGVCARVSISSMLWMSILLVGCEPPEILQITKSPGDCCRCTWTADEERIQHLQETVLLEINVKRLLPLLCRKREKKRENVIMIRTHTQDTPALSEAQKCRELKSK